MSSNGEKPIRRRMVNACVRCRRQKIKCGGKQPCENCKRREVECVYESDGNKILVTKRYISELRGKIERLEAKSEPEPAETTSLQEATPPSPEQDDNTQITNPIFSPTFVTHVTDQEGTPYHLGHSSNYSYTQRVLRLLRNHHPISPTPPNTWQPNGGFDLGWDGLRTAVEPEIASLPSVDHAVFLLNTVQFHAGQVYHLFDEASFMPQLYHFYENPVENVNRMRVWYIHFLTLLAFGKAFVVRDVHHNKPPGCDYFTCAVRMLPETTYLLSNFITAVEVLCCMALYYQAMDVRVSAFDKIGQAARLCLASGMHTPMQPDILDEAFIQRCRKAWWTVVVLDRQISAGSGMPIQVRDDDISAPLPVCSSSQNQAALEIQVNLSKALAHVVNTIYQRGGARNPNFISSIQNTLRDVADAGSSLNIHFKLPTSGNGGGVSPISAHLNMLYHQCIVVATRPFIFAYLEKRLETSEEEVHSLFLKEATRHILTVGIESARRMSGILCFLKDQHLIETFLPFDLECAFSAGTLVAIGKYYLPAASFRNECHSLNHIMEILQIMGSKGSLPAKARLSELQELKQILEEATQTSQDQLQVSIHVAEATVASELNNQLLGSTAARPQTLENSSLDLLDWIEGANVHEPYPQPQDLTAIAETLDSWDSMDWLSSYSGF